VPLFYTPLKGRRLLIKIKTSLSADAKYKTVSSEAGHTGLSGAGGEQAGAVTWGSEEQRKPRGSETPEAPPSRMAGPESFPGDNGVHLALLTNSSYH